MLRTCNQHVMPLAYAPGMPPSHPSVRPAAEADLPVIKAFEVMSRLPEAGWKFGQWRTLIQIGKVLDAASR